jgi:hypothetical protein
MWEPQRLTTLPLFYSWKILNENVVPYSHDGHIVTDVINALPAMAL